MSAYTHNITTHTNTQGAVLRALLEERDAALRALEDAKSEGEKLKMALDIADEALQVSRVCMYVFVYICMCMCVCMCCCLCVYVCMYVCVVVRMFVNVLCMYACIYMSIYIYIYIHTHTHTLCMYVPVTLDIAYKALQAHDVYVCMYVCIYTHTHVMYVCTCNVGYCIRGVAGMYMYVYIYIHTHTHSCYVCMYL
jgi:hypothetical protein